MGYFGPSDFSAVCRFQKPSESTLARVDDPTLIEKRSEEAAYRFQLQAIYLLFLNQIKGTVMIVPTQFSANYLIPYSCLGQVSITYYHLLLGVGIAFATIMIFHHHNRVKLLLRVKNWVNNSRIKLPPIYMGLLLKAVPVLLSFNYCSDTTLTIQAFCKHELNSRIKGLHKRSNQTFSDQRNIMEEAANALSRCMAWR